MIKEYKVIGQEDGWFTNRFNPKALETTLNKLAKDRWTLVSTSVARVPEGLFGTGSKRRDEMVIILERDAR